jgi:hypothetical protein
MPLTGKRPAWQRQVVQSEVGEEGKNPGAMKNEFKFYS